MDLPKKSSKSILTWEIDGLTEEQAHRFRETMDAIIMQGVLGIHDGKAVLSFDYEGTLREIRFEFNKWRREKKKVDNSLRPE